jgi:hypothetical protein
LIVGGDLDEARDLLWAFTNQEQLETCVCKGVRCGKGVVIAQVSDLTFLSGVLILTQFPDEGVLRPSQLEAVLSLPLPTNFLILLFALGPCVVEGKV